MSWVDAQYFHKHSGTTRAYVIGMIWKEHLNIPALGLYKREDTEHIHLNMLNKLFLWKSVFQYLRWGYM